MVNFIQVTNVWWVILFVLCVISNLVKSWKSTFQITSEPGKSSQITTSDTEGITTFTLSPRFPSEGSSVHSSLFSRQENTVVGTSKSGSPSSITLGHRVYHRWARWSDRRGTRSLRVCTTREKETERHPFLKKKIWKKNNHPPKKIKK